MKRILLVVSAVLLINLVHAQVWNLLGTDSSMLNANGAILKICTDTNNNVYCAGIFRDSTNHMYVAKWNVVLKCWQKLGYDSNSLNANADVLTLCTDKNGNLYAAGDFTDSSMPFSGHQYVAKWNGIVWSELGVGGNGLNVHGSISAICTDNNGNVYAAGSFRDSSNQCYVAKWDGMSWIELGGAGFNLNIGAIIADGSGDIYAAGSFTNSDGLVYVAKYISSTGHWISIGNGFDSGIAVPTLGDIYITSLSIDNLNNIYVALNTHDSVGIKASVYKFDSVWSCLGSKSFNNGINTVCAGDSGFVYVAGAFSDSFGHVYVARYDPISFEWHKYGTGSDSIFVNLTEPVAIGICIGKDNALYAGGTFAQGDSSYRYNVATCENSKLITNNYSFSNIASTIFPNPITDMLYFKLPDELIGKAIAITLVDVTGKQWYCNILNKMENNIESINFNFLPHGFYILSIGVNNINYKLFKL